MNFDLRPHINLDPAESQITEGGGDLYENCTWAALAQTLIDYGYGDPLSPQQMRELVTPGWHGGEGWDKSEALVAVRPDLYPAPPTMTIEQPGDVAAAMREWGAKGCMVHFGGWCTPDAHWTPGDRNGGISHAGRIVYADDWGIALWNVWTGYLVGAPDDFWRQAYDGGGLLVFHRSLTEELEMIDAHDLAVSQVLGWYLTYHPARSWGPALDPAGFDHFVARAEQPGQISGALTEFLGYLDRGMAEGGPDWHVPSMPAVRAALSAALASLPAEAGDAELIRSALEAALAALPAQPPLDLPAPTHPPTA